MSSITDDEEWSVVSEWLLFWGRWDDYGQWNDDSVWIDEGDVWTTIADSADIWSDA